MLELQASTLTRPHCKRNDGLMTGALSKNGHFRGLEKICGPCVLQPLHQCRLRWPRPAHVTASVVDLTWWLATSAYHSPRVPPTICLTPRSHSRALCSILPPLTPTLLASCTAPSLFLSCRLSRLPPLAADGTIVLFLDTSSPRLFPPPTG